VVVCMIEALAALSSTNEVVHKILCDFSEVMFKISLITITSIVDAWRGLIIDPVNLAATKAEKNSGSGSRSETSIKESTFNGRIK
jgi:hypothetical protein